MKIAVTGGTGFIGHYLLAELVKNPEDSVRCLTTRKNLDHAFRENNVEYLYCDNSTEALIRCLEGCEACIHMGALVPGQNETGLAFTEECIQNITYSMTVFDACVHHKIKNVVFASSIAVYGNKNSTPYVESQKCEPNSMYGVTKLAIERLAYLYHEQFGLNIKSLRIAQVFGARKKTKRPFLRMCIENCLKGILLTVYGTGTTSMDYVYVKDVVKAIVMALGKPDLYGEINVGTGYPTSTNELALAHCKGFGNAAGVVHLEDEHEKMFYRSLDIQKAKSLLGYEPTYSMEEACADMCRLYEQNQVPG